MDYDSESLLYTPKDQFSVSLYLSEFTEQCMRLYT